MNKIKEIVTAWATSFNPTDEQKELAENRYEICKSCPKLEEKMGYEICGECGCPIKKKIFTQKQQNTCPLNKWDDVEKKHREMLKKENKYKMI